jgi:hypothetical protein
MRNRFIKYYKIFALASVLALAGNGNAQQALASDIMTAPQNGYRLRAEVINGDTVPVMDLDNVYVTTEFVFKNVKQYEMWTRTKFNVKKVYPYAILAAAKLKEYDRELAKIEDEKSRKKYIRICEKDLRSEFEDELKGLSFSQGKVLMKLIDRETGKTTYQIVKQLRGGFEAAMWQTVARIFGHNMKTEYDGRLEDVLVERAVRLVETGRF